MAKFCKFCGTPLEEGQVCACQASQSAVATEAAPVAAPAAAPAVRKVEGRFPELPAYSRQRSA